MISYTHLYKQTKKICPLVTSVSFVVLVGLPQWLQRYMWLQLVLDVYTHLRKWLASLPHTDSLLYHFNTERIFQVCPPEFRFVWWMLKGKASVHPEESPEVSLPKCVAVRVTWKCKAVVQRPGAASRWAVLSLNPLPCCAQPLLLLYLQMDLHNWATPAGRWGREWLLAGLLQGTCGSRKSGRSGIWTGRESGSHQI